MPVLVNLTINMKIMQNTMLRTSRMSQIEYSPLLVPPVTSGCYVLCTLYIFFIVLPTVVLAIFPPTNICVVRSQIFPQPFVFDSMDQSTTLILMLFLPPLRQRADGLVLPPTSVILSRSGYLWMILIILLIDPLYIPP